MANSQDIRKEGTLEKKSRWLGMWRKRWTVLQSKNANKDNENGYVSTYKKEKVYKSPTESIRIDDETDIDAFIDKKDKNEITFFIYNKKEKEQFLFKAKSKKDRDEWIECITKNVHRASIEEVVDGLNHYQKEEATSTNGNEEQKYSESVNDGQLQPKTVQNDVENEKETVNNKQENDVTNVSENMDKNNEEKQDETKEQIAEVSTSQIFDVKEDVKQNDNEQNESKIDETKESAKNSKSELKDEKNIDTKPQNTNDVVNDTSEDLKTDEQFEKDKESPTKPIPQSQDEVVSVEEIKNQNENGVDIESELDNMKEKNTDSKSESAQIDKDIKVELQSNEIEKEVEDTEEDKKPIPKSEEQNPDEEVSLKENKNEDENTEPAQSELNNEKEDEDIKEPEIESKDQDVIGDDEEDTKMESTLTKSLKSEDNVSGNSESEANDAIAPIKEAQTFESKQMDVHTPETPQSMASSFQSDGEPVFGDRWGFDLNATDHEDENENVQPKIDTSQMEYANIVLIGNSKSGKSMLVNNILQNEQNEKYEETIKNVVKFKVFLDENDDEEEKSKNGVCCSLIDTNGNMQNIKDVIVGIGQSDICILCVSVTDENFDSFKDYLRILNTFGIERFIVCLSYMDNIDYNQSKYEKCQAKIEKIMKKIGIKAKKCAFIPISNVNGDNITNVSTNDSFSWYKGWTFKKSKGMTVCDAIKTMIVQFANKKVVDQSCILPISEIVSDDVCIGKIEQGMIKQSDTIKSALNGNEFVIDSIHRGSQSMQSAKHGDFVSISVSAAKNDNLSLCVGDVLFVDDALSIKPCKTIKALVAVSSSEKINVGKFEGMICIRSSMVQCELTKIYWTMSAKNDKKIKNAQYLVDKAQAEIELVFKEPFIATSFKECECLGRFVVIYEDKPVLVGKITSTQ